MSLSNITLNDFRAIAGDASVKDSRHVYIANGTGVDPAQQEKIDGKSQLCFNAAGKPRNFTKPKGNQLAMESTFMRSQLLNAVRGELGARNPAIAMIEAKLFGSIGANRQLNAKIASKPLEKREIASVLNMMEAAKAIQRLEVGESVMDSLEGVNDFDGDRAGVTTRLVPEGKSGEAMKVVGEAFAKLAAKPSWPSAAELQKMAKAFVAKMEKKGLIDNTLNGSRGDFEVDGKKFTRNNRKSMFQFRKVAFERMFLSAIAPAAKQFKNL